MANISLPSGSVFLVTQLAGTVNTGNVSATVTWASGDKFSPLLVGKQIIIAGTSHGIAAYVSPTQITIDQAIVVGALGQVYTIPLY
jgi:hypothetical protein